EGTWPRRLTMWASTFLLTCAGWVLFRANTMADAWYILTHFAIGWDFDRISTEQFLLRQMPVAIAEIALLEAVQLPPLVSQTVPWGTHAPLPAHAHERGAPEAASSTNSCGYTRPFGFLHASDVNHAVASIVIVGALPGLRPIVQRRLDFKSNALGWGR